MLNIEKKPKKYEKLQTTLSRMVLWTVAAAFLIISLIGGAYLVDNNRRRILASEEQTLGIAARQLRYVQQSVAGMARQIAVDKRVQDGVLVKPETVFREIVNRDNMKNLLMTYANMYPYVESVMIDTGETLYSTNRTLGVSDIQGEDWYKDFLARGINHGFTVRHIETMEQGTMDKEVISYVLLFREINSANRVLGRLIINLRYDEFISGNQLNSDYLAGWRIFDRYGNVIAQNGEMTASFADVASSNPPIDTVLISRELEDGWIILSQISSAALFTNMSTLVLLTLLCSAVFLFVLMVLLRSSIRRITRPIADLHDASVRVGKGDFDINVHVSANNELSDLATSMNHMAVDLRDLMTETVRYERLTKDMEINRLMLQIKPHFIYNTLNSIVYMASAAGNAEIERFTKAFVSLLQNTLGVHSVFVPLRKELDGLRSYMEIQKYRYPDKLELTVDCPEELLASAIPSVLLQPLVENSIFHGLVPKVGKGRVSIEVRRQDENNMVIRIADDGVGMDETQLARLVNSTEPVPGVMHSVGFLNVCKRIEHIYGPGYGVTVKSMVDEGTLMTILLPCRPFEAEREANP